MEDLLFWKSWTRQFKIIFSFFLLLLAGVVTIVLTHYMKGLDALIEWNAVVESVNQKQSIETFAQNLQQLTIQAENYLAKKHFLASTIKVNTLAAFIHFVFLGISTALAITAISNVRHIAWFLGLFTVFTVWLLSLKTPLLQVFGQANNYPLLVLLVVYGGMAFYFYAFAKKTHSLYRLLAFGLITAVFWVTIATQSTLDYPVITLVNNSALFHSGAAIFLLVLVGYDILHFFLTLITLSKGGSKASNLLNFVIVSTLYIGILVQLYLHITGEISWLLFDINPLYLVLVAVILGFWGYRQRVNEMYGESFKYTQTGAYLYFAIAIMGLSSVGYAYGTGNSSFEVMYHDLTVYVFLAMGCSFLFYTFVNFHWAFLKNLPVHKVLYQPKHIPYHFVIIIALFIVGVMLGKDYLTQIKYGKAAWQNYQGDVHHVNGDHILASSFYKRALRHDKGNHKAAYTLASIALKNNDYEEAIKQLEACADYQPSPYVLVNLAEAYRHYNSKYYDLFTLKEALKRFPENGQLLHNLATTFDRMNIIDSAHHYYEKAAEHLRTPEVARANALAMYTKHDITKVADSLINLKDFKNNVDYQTNRVAYANRAGIRLDEPLNTKITGDSLADGQMLSYLHNFALNQIHTSDTTSRHKFEELARHPGNQGYAFNIHYPLIYEYFYEQQYLKAKNTADEIISFLPEGKRVYYNHLTGMMMYRIGAGSLAAKYFDRSNKVQVGYRTNTSGASLATILCRERQYDWAEELFSELQHLDSLHADYSREMLSILQTPSVTEAFDFEDSKKTRFLLFSPLRLKDPEQSINLLQSIENNGLRGWACVKLLDEIITNGDLALAQEIWDIIPREDVSKYIMDEYNYQLMRLKILEEEYDKVLGTIDELDFSLEREILIPHLKAVSYEGMGDMDKAKMFYEKALKKHPFHEETIIRASEFYYQESEDQEKAYNLIVNAVENDPLSIRLKKAYVLIAGDLHYEQFGKSALSDLQQLLPDEEYNVLKKQFEDRIKKNQEKFSEW